MPPTLFDLAGRVAIVTGSSRGLGKAMARGLDEAGARVVVCSWDAEETEATARELCEGRLEALALTADVSSRSDCERLVSAAVAHFGSLDVIVCNAGIDIILPAERYEDDQWNRIIEVNLRGCLNASLDGG